MKTIQEAVEEILTQSPHLSEALSEGIVNFSALSRTLRPEVEKKELKNFTDGAIVMALRRLQKLTKPARSRLHAGNTVRNISVRSHLVQYAYENSLCLHRVQGELLKLAEAEEDAYVHFARGAFDTAIIVSDSLEDHLRTLARGERILKRFTDLSAISIRFHSSITHIPGIYYPFFQTLAWRGINIVQVVTGFAELTFLFEEKDVDRAFTAIKALTVKPAC